MSDPKEYISRSFREFTAKISPGKAVEEITTSGADYGVIFDEDGAPAVLLTREDCNRALEAGAKTILDAAAEPPPTIIMPEGLSIEEAAAAPAITLLEHGARGAIVVGLNHVVGIAPADVFLNVLGSGQIASVSRQMSAWSLPDSQLGGQLNTPTGKVVCRECGYLNEVRYLDSERVPNCKNPQGPTHKLKIS